MIRRASACALLALFACTPDPPPAGDGLLGDHPLNPFPVGALHTAGGRLDLDPDAFDLPAGLTPLPVERLAWRTGFSPAQTAVVVLPELDPAALPGWRAPTPGAGGVRLADLTTGTWLPVMAEVDQHPDADPDAPTVLIRPLVALQPGHQIAVALTTALTPRGARFAGLLADNPPEDLRPHAEDLRAVVDALETLGTSPDELALAWSFPVGDGTAPLRSAWAQFEPPTAWQFDAVREGDALPPRTWRAAEGRFTVRSFLQDGRLALTDAGGVRPVGEDEAYLYVHIPASVADAPAGTVPVLLFGHGLFSHPTRYLDNPEDPSGVLALADDGGFVVVASTWRGLSFPDLGLGLAVAGDFGRMHELTDRLVQAQADTAALLALLADGALFADPVFQGASGQSLPDPGALRYYGISLGGIEGAVMLARDTPLDAAVLHVGGASWSTMLERSSNWPTFELALGLAIPEPRTRQRLYATSQLWWDVADPLGYTAELSQRAFLLQESIGDEQVPNLTTRALARSVGLPLLQPAAEPVWGLDTVDGPLPPGSRALVQFDPQTERPPEANRPAPVTRAHDLPRRWVGTARQTLDHLAVDGPGQVVHHCGAVVCSASAQGD